MISQNDFQREWRAIEPLVLEAARRVGASGWYILGKEVERFEQALSEFWGVRYAVGVGNGMDALEIGLRCLGLKPGEKVLTSPLSAFASTLAIIRAGGIPVFVDVDDCGLIDLEQCRQVLSQDRSIRFFIPVHLYGFAVDLIELRRLKEEFQLLIVEDCAQSIDASFAGVAVGTIGQVAATSFYPTKNLGALGDGGALLVGDVELASVARTLRNYGQSELYLHDKIGLNSRLDEIHAAILCDALLPNLPQWTQSRRATAERYLDHITHPLIELPAPGHQVHSVWHLFPVLVEDGLRGNLRDHLKAAQIQTSIHYPRLILDQGALEEYGQYEILRDPVKAGRITRCELSLPIHPFLDDTEIDTVIDACNSWAP